MDERPRFPWALLILPILALVYFSVVLYLGAARTEIRGIPTDWLVWGGLAFFGIVILIEIPFMFRRAPRAEEAPVVEAMPMEEASAMAIRPPSDDEHMTTTENQQGLRVLEYSAPAKSRNRGAVYAKTYVPVTKEHVLRVETLAAMPSEL